jgi:hypothetical protein
VIRDGKGGELEGVRLLHQTIQPARSIEQRILGVKVEMNEFGVRHGARLRPRFPPAQVKRSHPDGNHSGGNRESTPVRANEGNGLRNIPRPGKNESV